MNSYNCLGPQFAGWGFYPLGELRRVLKQVPNRDDLDSLQKIYLVNETQFAIDRGHFTNLSNCVSYLPIISTILFLPVLYLSVQQLRSTSFQISLLKPGTSDWRLEHDRVQQISYLARSVINVLSLGILMAPIDIGLLLTRVYLCHKKTTQTQQA